MRSAATGILGLAKIPRLAKIPSRGLRCWSSPKPELVVANNSGMLFTLTSYIRHGRSVHPSLTVVMPPFWLDRIHDDFRRLDWGQTIRGLPHDIRVEFMSLYPDYPIDKPIDWGHFADLRKAAVERLRRAGIDVFTGIPEITMDSVSYRIKTNEGVIDKPLDTHFYSSWRIHDVEHGYGRLPKVPHVELYTDLSKNTPEFNIIIGGGRSAVWLAKHFPEKIFLCIVDNKDKKLALFEDESMPSNVIEIISKDEIKRGEYLLTESSSIPEGASVLDKNGVSIFSGRLLCAMGLGQSKLIMDSPIIPLAQKTVYPDCRELWTAPTDETPVGSLIEATLRWASLTENMDWVGETFCFHPSRSLEGFFKFAGSKGLSFSLEFFDILREKITGEVGLKTVPNLDGIVEIYREAYKTSLGVTADSQEATVSLQKLCDTLREYEKQRAATYNESRMRLFGEEKSPPPENMPSHLKF